MSTPPDSPLEWSELEYFEDSMISQVADSEVSDGDTDGFMVPAEGEYSEPQGENITTEWEMLSSSGVTDTSSIAGPEHSIDAGVTQGGTSLRDRLRGIKTNQARGDVKRKRSSSSEPLSPEQVEQEVSQERPSSAERPAWLKISEDMYAPFRLAQNTDLGSGRTTPHMLRIPPEVPPYVSEEEDKEESRVRKKRRLSPSYSQFSEKVEPVHPAPSIINFDEPTPISRKRKRQDVMSKEEGGSDSPTLVFRQSTPVDDSTDVSESDTRFPVIYHTEDSSPRPRKKRLGTPDAPSEDSGPPTPIFRPAPSQSQSSLVSPPLTPLTPLTPETQVFPSFAELDGSYFPSSPAVAQLGAQVESSDVRKAKAQNGQSIEGPKNSCGKVDGRPSSILKLFEIPELFARISSRLGEKDCINLTSTCKSLRGKKTQIWDINAHMSHFLQSPTAFRSLMATHGALVSGSDALQFLSRERFENSDLDVYVEVKGARELAKHLEAVEGYTYVPYKGQSEQVEEAIDGRIDGPKHYHRLKQGGRPKPEGTSSDGGYPARYDSETLEGVLCFHKSEAGDQSSLQIQLIITQCPPIHTILSNYYATHIFNFYDYRRAYALFPNETFVNRRGYKTHPITEHLVDCCDKYAKRGYDIQDYADWTEKSPEGDGEFGEEVVREVKDSREIRRGRRVGDCFSWSLDLEMTGVDVPEHPPSSLLEYATFGMGYAEWWNMYGETGGEVTPYIKVKCAPYRSDLIGLIGADFVVETLEGEWEKYLSKVLGMVMKRGTQAGYRADIPLWFDMFLEHYGELDRLRKELESAPWEL